MAKSEKAHSLLWEIRHRDRSLAGYVFGTMHSRDQRVHSFIPALDPYLRECRSLATEFELTEGQVTGSASLPDVPDWVSGLPDKVVRQLGKLLAKYGMGPLDGIRHLPPLVLLQAVTEQWLGREASDPQDMALAVRAQIYGLTLTGVETLTEQMEILASIPVADQVDQLKAVLRHRDKQARKVRKQVKWYLEQDIRQLYRSSRKQLGPLRRLLLLDRNRRMARRMGEMIRTEPQFLAVGAAHLWGGKGVLNGLKKQGFRVKPIELRLNG